MEQLDRRAIGKTYKHPAYEVTAEAIALYADAIDEHAACHNDCGCPGEMLAPPLFAVRPMVSVLFAGILDPEIGIDLARLVHGEQWMEFSAPIRPGDVLIPGGKVLGISSKSTGEVLELEQWLERDGEVVARAISYLFVRALNPPPRGPRPPRPEPVEPEYVYEHTGVIAPDQSLRYSEASGDHNPLHKDPEFAKAAGFPGVILQGLCTMGMALGRLITGTLEGDSTRVEQVHVRFARPVFMEDELTTRVWESKEPGRYEFDVINQSGKAVLKNAWVKLR